MDRMEEIRARMNEILEGSTLASFQYALPTLTDRFMDGSGTDEEMIGLGRSVVIGTNALLVFASAAAVCVMNYVDVLEGESEANMDTLENAFAGLEKANEMLLSTEQKLVGEDDGN